MGQGRIDGGHELPGLWGILMLLRLAGGPTQARSGFWATRPHLGCYGGGFGGRRLILKFDVINCTSW